VCKRAPSHTDCDAERWNGRGDIFLEYRSDDIDDQHKHCGNLLCDSNRHEGLHGFRVRDLDSSSESDRSGGGRGRLRERASRDPDCNTERRDRRSDICLEHGGNDIDDQHEHGRYIQRDRNRHEGLHRFRLRHLDGGFFIDGGGQ
jgi:hypothetical protein